MTHLFHKWGKWEFLSHFAYYKELRRCETCGRTQIKWARGS